MLLMLLKNVADLDDFGKFDGFYIWYDFDEFDDFDHFGQKPLDIRKNWSCSEINTGTAFTVLLNLETMHNVSHIKLYL